MRSGPSYATSSRRPPRPSPSTAAEPTRGAPGRSTGLPRSTCVRYLDTPGGFLVWGSGSGSPQDPDWFRNLRTVELAEVRVRATRLRVRPRELLGDEREAVWTDVVLAAAPEVEKFARKAGRPIPVAVLEIVGPEVAVPESG